METINNIFKNRCLFRIVMRVLILVSMLGMSSVAYSQAGTTYPVEINAMLTPPYGTCLTDYVGTNRFQCNVLMRDMRATEYYFRIVMTVKDQASGRVVFQTQSDRKMIAPGRPVYMAESGIFGEFFKSQNIKQNYSVYKDGCLKEGAYNFVFQVVDDKDSRHIPISKECVFTARLNEGGAPFLIYPYTGDSIGCNQDPVSLTWQMPFVTGEQIEYLVEVCPNHNGLSGLDCLNNNSKPANFYYSARSFMPMHQLVKTTTMLTPNTTYYWRVSIIDQFGKIKPNSTSKIDSFVYCGTPIEPEPYIPVKEPMVKAIAANLDTVKFDSVLTKDNSTKAYWTLDEVRFNYIAYALDVRKKSQDTWSTYHIEIKQEDPEEKDNYGLSNLKYNEPYEARMQYLKLSDNGDTLYAPYSDTITFTVPNPMDTADCGEILPIKDCNDAKGLVLKQYDTLYANGTPVVLDSVTYKSGDSSVISGFGTVAFPILSNFKLKMQFKEVSVNCYGELLKGKVVSVYNESTGAIIDLNHMFGKGDGGGSQSSSEQPDVTKCSSKEEAQKKISTGGFAQVGDSIYTKDSSGNLVNVGKALSLTADQYTNTDRLDVDNVYCVFHNNTDKADYIGFDADEQYVFRKVASLKDHYNSFSLQAGSSDPYIIPYVANNPGRVVKLTATLDGKGWDGTYNKDSVKFVMPLSGGNYLSLNSKKDGDRFIVDFVGGTPDTHSDVYAIVLKGTQYVNVGKIIVESYEWRKQKVKFVPVVNDYTVDTDAISKELNKIYGRFGITYSVELEETITSERIEELVQEGFALKTDGLFSKESDAMVELQHQYRLVRSIDKMEDSTAYFFLIEKPSDYTGVAGDMPQNRNCGYIFMQGSSTLSDGRLVAHELGHGIYRLDHVFEPAYGLKQGTTNNLLDYNNGNQLAHHQWELIKNPGFAWALFEKDEDNMLTIPPCVTKAVINTVFGEIASRVVDNVVEEITGEAQPDKSFVDQAKDAGLNLGSNLLGECFPSAKLFKELYDGGVGMYQCLRDSNPFEECVCKSLFKMSIHVMVDKMKDIFKKSDKLQKFIKNQKSDFQSKHKDIVSKFVNKMNLPDVLVEPFDFVLQGYEGALLDASIAKIEDTFADMMCKAKTGSVNVSYLSGNIFASASNCFSDEYTVVTVTSYMSPITKCSYEKINVNDNPVVFNVIPTQVESNWNFSDDNIHLVKVEDVYGYLPGIGGTNNQSTGVVTGQEIKIGDSYTYQFRINSVDDGIVKATKDKQVLFFIEAEGVYARNGGNVDKAMTSTMYPCTVPDPVPTTYTENDECSKSDLFKATAKSKSAAKAAANNSRIQNGECVYGLPECSQWIKDEHDAHIYSINSPTCKGGVINNLFTVTLDKPGVANKGTRVMNLDVARNALNKEPYYIFKYAKCTSKNVCDSILVMENGEPHMHAAKEFFINYFKEYAMKIFIKVTYDWTLLSVKNAYKTTEAGMLSCIKGIFPSANDMYYTQGNGYKLLSNKSNVSNQNGSLDIKELYPLFMNHNSVLSADQVSTLNSKIAQKMKTEFETVDFCNMCVLYSKIYGIVARSLSEIPYSFEDGKSVMYTGGGTNSADYRFVFTRLKANHWTIGQTVTNSEGREIQVTNAELEYENNLRLQYISNALSVVQAYISNSAEKVLDGDGSYCLSANAFFLTADRIKDSMSNLSVKSNGDSCPK